MGGGPIADYTQFVVDLCPFEPRPLGTFPMIRMTMKSEAAIVILACTPTRANLTRKSRRRRQVRRLESMFLKRAGLVLVVPRAPFGGCSSPARNRVMQASFESLARLLTIYDSCGRTSRLVGKVLVWSKTETTYGHHEISSRDEEREVGLVSSWSTFSNLGRPAAVAAKQLDAYSTRDPY